MYVGLKPYSKEYAHLPLSVVQLIRLQRPVLRHFYLISYLKSHFPSCPPDLLLSPVLTSPHPGRGDGPQPDSHQPAHPAEPLAS